MLNLVIFASRESFYTLAETLSWAARALPMQGKIEVIINGNFGLASRIKEYSDTLSETQTTKIFVWNILAADKANAWNQHIHKIWDGNSHSIYLDGYVRITSDALSAIMSTLQEHPKALGTSGVPSVGYSAKKIRRQMTREGGFHGNLCAISAQAIQTLRDRKIFLPTGIYRVDSAMGAYLSFGLDNLRNPWAPHMFLPITEQATWICPPKSWYKPNDVLAWFKRRQRQAKGDFENAAIRHFLTELKKPIWEMPNDIKSLIGNWNKHNQIDVERLQTKSSRHRAAYREILVYEPPHLTSLEPVLISA